MAQPETIVNLNEKLAAFDEQWKPKIVGQVNDLHLKVVKLLGEFVWHQHAETDEFFMVISGHLTIRMRDQDDATLRAGDFFVVPRGVDHCPVAHEETALFLLEPVGTSNTGDEVPGERTAEPEWI